MGRRAFGQITTQRSGRYQARYTGPDVALHTAPWTFTAKIDAEAWLVDERRLITSGEWTPPKVRQARLAKATTFGHYASQWIDERAIKPRTRAEYRRLLKGPLEPLSEVRLPHLSPASIRSWYATLSVQRPTQRARAYSLVRAILATAVVDDEIPANPCHIRGAGNAKRTKKIEPATLSELEVIVASVPARYQAMILLASWCALRFGELIELRRRDVDLKSCVVHVRRGAVRVNGEVIVDMPKSEAGVRDVAIPPHLKPLLKGHLEQHVTGTNGLLFPARDGVSTMAPSTLYKVYYPARTKAGRADLRFHDLRHTGAVLAAQTGATLAELMGRLGHSTPQAALRYQHVARGRDAEIATALSALVATKRQQPRSKKPKKSK